MKTFNLNKIILLISLFLISAVFTTAADASCRYTDAGLLDVAVDGSGNSDAPVYETSRGARGDQCSDTPDEYEITFYKLGICTASTAANDLSSCQYIVDNDAGVKHVIVAGTSGAMAIPEFAKPRTDLTLYSAIIQFAPEPGSYLRQLIPSIVAADDNWFHPLLKLQYR